MIMSELLKIYYQALPNGEHTRDQIKALGEAVISLDSFSPHRMRELVTDSEMGIRVFIDRGQDTNFWLLEREDKITKEK
jgi:hypothetical protein